MDAITLLACSVLIALSIGYSNIIAVKVPVIVPLNTVQVYSRQKRYGSEIVTKCSQSKL